MILKFYRMPFFIVDSTQMYLFHYVWKCGVENLSVDFMTTKAVEEEEHRVKVDTCLNDLNFGRVMITTYQDSRLSTNIIHDL